MLLITGWLATPADAGAVVTACGDIAGQAAVPNTTCREILGTGKSLEDWSSLVRCQGTSVGWTALWGGAQLHQSRPRSAKTYFGKADGVILVLGVQYLVEVV